MGEVRELHFKSIVVASKTGAPDADAKLAVCDCGGEVFFVWQVEGQDHPHFQCQKCNEAFCCSLGECHVELR